MAGNSTEERLAVIETTNKRQSDDIKEILNEVKNISAFIYEIKPKIDALVDADLTGRLTKVETQKKIYVGIGTGLFGLLGLAAMLKDKVIALFS